MLNKKKDNQAAPKHSKSRKAGDARKASGLSISKLMTIKLLNFLVFYSSFYHLLENAVTKKGKHHLIYHVKAQLIKSGMPDLTEPERQDAIELLEGMERFYLDSFWSREAVWYILRKIKKANRS